ncbi:cupredoxin domain-containing protein [Rheinheimera mesophila]|uniref:Cupredoxin domain-containing protein n=1 Tax=Rheinheimera mesophila TaxID=1547515 RepID=A0A3P3QNT7_9GAMM|nr:cupredoxin domain-containing protein [Rheinheimera mesophila]RRJ22897.1 cupredoxin domain-containing protein [Rheinheimera mesophila]
MKNKELKHKKLRPNHQKLVAVKALLLLTLPVVAEQNVFELRIKDHLFQPSVLYVPAGEKVKLLVLNQDPSPEEFESFSLNREKVILGLGKATLFIGPLAPGQYQFFGEYNPDSAQGVLIALPEAEWLQHKANHAY